MAKGIKRLTLDMGANFDALLTEESETASSTKAELIRRAVATYAYLRRESGDTGQVTIVGKDGRMKDLILAK